MGNNNIPKNKENHSISIKRKKNIVLIFLEHKAQNIVLIFLETA